MFTASTLNVNDFNTIYCVIRYKGTTKKKEILASLIKNKLTTSRSHSDSTTISTVTVVGTIAVNTVSVYRRATIGNNLDVEVSWRAVVWVWNQREVGNASGVTSTEVQRSPVTDTSRSRTPSTSLLLRNTSIVDIVLSRSLHASPVEVVVRVDTGQRRGRAWVNNGWDNHVLGTRVISLTDGNTARQLRADNSFVNTSLTQVLGILVGSVQETTLTDQTTHGNTVTRLVAWPLSLGHTWLTGIRAVRALSTRTTSRSVRVVDTRPTTESQVVKSDDTVSARWELRARDGTILEWTSRIGARRAAGSRWSSGAQGC